jgi:hypothetical protein
MSQGRVWSMARTIHTLTLALLLASQVAALPNLPSDPVSPESPLESLSRTSDAVDAVTEAVRDAVPCPQVVRVTQHEYTSRVTERRMETNEWRASHIVKETLLVRVPITTPLPDLALARAAIPVSPQDLQIGNGYTVRAVTLEREVPVVVRETVTLEYVQWTRHDEEILLNPVVGAPFLASGQGRLETRCGPVEFGAVPPLSMPCWNCVPQDGWRVVDRSFDVRLRTAADEDLPLGPMCRCVVPEAVASKGAHDGASQSGASSVKVQGVASGITSTATRTLGYAALTLGAVALLAALGRR